MTRFNYLERGRKVLLLKPCTDTRDGVTKVKSRIGLEADAIVIHPGDEISVLMAQHDADVIIVDEAQFLVRDQVVQLRDIVSKYKIPVMCYGLRTDFRSRLFEGSKALFELADEVQDIPSICDCGEKAIINARFNTLGQIITDGDVVLIGGNEQYKAVCWSCYQRLIKGANQ
jgi:thymidine kinase